MGYSFCEAGSVESGSTATSEEGYPTIESPSAGAFEMQRLEVNSGQIPEELMSLE